MSDAPSGAPKPKRSDVGHGRPPKEHQFKAGAPSANPKGRPPKVKRRFVQQALDEQIWVVEGAHRRRASKEEIIALKLVNAAAQGDLRATRLVYDLTGEFETSAHEEEIAELKAAHAAQLEELRWMMDQINTMNTELLDALAAAQKPERQNWQSLTAKAPETPKDCS